MYGTMAMRMQGLPPARSPHPICLQWKQRWRSGHAADQCPRPPQLRQEA